MPMRINNTIVRVKYMSITNYGCFIRFGPLQFVKNIFGVNLIRCNDIGVYNNESSLSYFI